jgi:hypothetical protein
MRNYPATILALLCLGAASPVQAQKTQLTDEEVKVAVATGVAQKKTFRKEFGIGLRMHDTWGYTLQILTPTAWIELRALMAAYEYNTYTVSEDDLRPVLRVFVTPDYPKTITYGCAPVGKTVLRDESKQTVIQAQKQTASLTGYQNLFGASTSCTSSYSEFALADVERIRSMSADREFDILLLTDGRGGEKSFRVKKKHFERLP